ncbi:MAG: NUMOD4 motif-containing HNH endonuclease [Bacteroidales bacterium]|nr:NUMOD4 motif-containing HNH endonuclease [Bacteroidales bacterium]
MTNELTFQNHLFANGLEIWRDIEGYEGLYQVSDYGRVRSLRFGKIKILKQGTIAGYKELNLTDKEGVTTTHYVHRLVALSFIPNDAPDEKIFVNHINHVRDCNCVENLEWVTPAQNIDMIARLRMSKTRAGKPNYRLRKAVRCLDDGEIYQSIGDCATAYNVSHSNISSCLTGRSMSCRGWQLEYA